jgi:hypothetical protein
MEFFQPILVLLYFSFRVHFCNCIDAVFKLFKVKWLILDRTLLEGIKDRKTRKGDTKVTTEAAELTHVDGVLVLIELFKHNIVLHMLTSVELEDLREVKHS